MTEEYLELNEDNKPKMPDNFKKNNDGNHGFIADIIGDDHYLGGKSDREIGAKKEVLNPGGDWRPYLPMPEFQRKNGVESMGCTNYGTYNAIETILIKRYGAEQEINWAERFGNIVSGTTTSGNSPHTAAEFLRRLGTVEEKELPFDESINTWNKYYSPKPMTSKYLDLAKNTFLDVYDFEHEWVYGNGLSLSQKQALLVKALDRSPIGISVYANYGARTNSDGLIYKKSGDIDNHWCVLVGYEYGKKWYVFDTYDQFVKEYVWDYNFMYAKEYYFKKKPPVWETPSDGELDGKDIPKGSWLNFWEFWRWIPRKIGGWFKN